MIIYQSRITSCLLVQSVIDWGGERGTLSNCSRFSLLLRLQLKNKEIKKTYIHMPDCHSEEHCYKATENSCIFTRARPALLHLLFRKQHKMLELHNGKL